MANIEKFVHVPKIVSNLKISLSHTEKFHFIRENEEWSKNFMERLKNSKSKNSISKEYLKKEVLGSSANL